MQSAPCVEARGLCFSGIVVPWSGEANVLHYSWNEQLQAMQRQDLPPAWPPAMQPGHLTCTLVGYPWGTDQSMPNHLPAAIRSLADSALRGIKLFWAIQDGRMCGSTSTLRSELPALATEAFLIRTSEGTALQGPILAYALRPERHAWMGSLRFVLCVVRSFVQ